MPKQESVGVSSLIKYFVSHISFQKVAYKGEKVMFNLAITDLLCIRVTSKAQFLYFIHQI